MFLSLRKWKSADRIVGYFINAAQTQVGKSMCRCYGVEEVDHTHAGENLL